jgi:ferredoxin
VYSQILILHFSRSIVQKPIVCGLVKDYNLIFNILNATILPRKEGRMVLELTGSRKNFKEGVKYLKEQGVQVQTTDQEVRRDIEKCIHCGACTAVCPTSALSVLRTDMTIEFDQEKCSLCELCVPVCPTRAMIVRPTAEAIFG